MKKIILILFMFIAYCYSESLETFEPYEINDSTQWILIKTENTKNPVLLYLSGGPGISMIPWAHVNTITDQMLEHFTVVHWDQRGAGLSYDPDIPVNTITISQYIDDTYAVIELLKQKLKTDKIFLLGHSWGTILGMYYCQKYPNDITVFIGVGQSVTYYDREKVSRDWLGQKILEAGNEEDLEKHREITWADRGLIQKYGGTIHNITVNDLVAMRRSSPYSPEKYTRELTQKGTSLVRGNMREELWKIDFRKEIPKIEVPVYFFLGKYDYITPASMVVDYCEMLEAPKKELVWFHESAHRIDIEEPLKFQKTLIRIKEENIND